MSMMFATPTPATKATAARPRDSEVNAPAAAARAAIASEGRFTLTSLGFSGLAVPARTVAGFSAWLGSESDSDQPTAFALAQQVQLAPLNQ